MKSLIKHMLKITPPSSPEIEAYARLKARGFSPDLIVDVGAYEGGWTRMARSVFTHCPVIMIEAQANKIPGLKQVCDDLGDVTLVSEVLGSQAGEEVTFYEMETGSSLLAENSNVPRREIRMQTRTLDDVIGDRGNCLFVKIDVQGAELDILSGGQAVLSRCEVVQLETALLPYNAGAPLMNEVLSRMEQWGFSPFDFAGFIRPNGIDLVQTDIIFVRTLSPWRTSFFTY